MGMSVLQEWVMELGLRHQGVLLGAVRGCDSVPKEDASKALVRSLRGVVLRSYHPYPTSFIDKTVKTPNELAAIRKEGGRAVTLDELHRRMALFFSNCDHHPQHFVAHLMHAAEIVGYKHPDESIREAWLWLYHNLVHGLHLMPESQAQMDARLGASEADHAKLAEALALESGGAN